MSHRDSRQDPPGGYTTSTVTHVHQYNTLSKTLKQIQWRQRQGEDRLNKETGCIENIVIKCVIFFVVVMIKCHGKSELITDKSACLWSFYVLAGPYKQIQFPEVYI